MNVLELPCPLNLTDKGNDDRARSTLYKQEEGEFRHMILDWGEVNRGMSGRIISYRVNCRSAFSQLPVKISAHLLLAFSNFAGLRS